MKGCIMQLKSFTPKDGSTSTDGLLNALRFTTLHLVSKKNCAFFEIHVFFFLIRTMLKLLARSKLC